MFEHTTSLAGILRARALLCFLILIPSLSWAERLAVLNIEGSVVSERRLYLTDLLRVYARRHTSFDLLTQENIEVLIDPEVLNECVNKCEVTVGRLLGSHRVISGVMFGGKRLVLKLHDTKTGSLVNSVVVSGEIESRLESGFLDLMGLKDMSFDVLEARYLRARELKEAERERERLKRLREREEKRKIERARKREIAKRKESERLRLLELSDETSWVIKSPLGRGFMSYHPYALSDFDMGINHREKSAFSSRLSFTWSRHRAYDVSGKGFPGDYVVLGTSRYLDISRIVYSENHIPFDKDKNALDPIEIGITTLYLNEAWYKEDLESREGIGRSKRWGLVFACLGGLLLISTPGMVTSPEGERSLYERAPRVVGSLIGVGVVSSALSIWLLSDEDPKLTYHYPELWRGK